MPALPDCSRPYLIAGGLNASIEGIHSHQHRDDRLLAMLGQHLAQDSALQRPVQPVSLNSFQDLGENNFYSV